MADEADSKSVVGNHVRVQVPLPAVEIAEDQKRKGFQRFLYAPDAPDKLPPWQRAFSFCASGGKRAFLARLYV